MAPEENEKLNQILIHVGATKEGIANIKEDVRGIKDSLSALNSSTIKRPECSEKHTMLSASLDKVKDDLVEIKGDVKAVKSSTGQGYPAVSNKFNRKKRQTGEVKDLRYWLEVGKSLLGIVGFLTAAVVAIVGFGRYIERVESMAKKIEDSQRSVTRAVKQTAQKEPRVIYVKVPANAEPDEKKVLPRRRNRKRTVGSPH